MKFQFPVFLPLLVLPLLSALSGASFIKQRRAASSEFSLYAYGDGVDGLPVFYGDGIAYIGDAPPPSVSSSMNVTFSPGPSDSSAWVLTGATSMKLFINATAGAFYPVGFTGSTIPSSDLEHVTTSGFGFYGHTVVNFANNDVTAQFWVTEASDRQGTFVLGWNQDGTKIDGSVPVTVRDVAPVTIDKS